MRDSREILRASPEAKRRSRTSTFANHETLSRRGYDSEDCSRTSVDSLKSIKDLPVFSLDSVDENTINNGQHFIEPNNNKSVPAVSLLVQIWIVRQFASNFGFAYKLNTGSVGVCFHDKTKAITSVDGTRFQYHGDVERYSSTFYIANSPSELKDKVDCLRRAISVFADDSSPDRFRSMNVSSPTSTVVKFSSLDEDLEDSEIVNTKESTWPYVLRYALTTNFALFRFSNRTVQAVYRDNR